MFTERRPTRVLIVEDHDDTREMYVLSLQFHGIEVQAVADVAAAFDVAVAWRPDLILTDFALATGGNGAELCKRIHHDDRTRHIPALVVTGSHRKQDVEQILGAGCADIRLKPYLLDAMLDDISRLTASAPWRVASATTSATARAGAHSAATQHDQPREGFKTPQQSSSRDNQAIHRNTLPGSSVSPGKRNRHACRSTEESTHAE